MIVADIANVAAGVGTLIAFGRGLHLLIAPEMECDRFERAGVAYVLGTGAAALLWTLFMPMYGTVPPVVVISAIAWAVAAIGFWRSGVKAPVMSGFGPTGGAAVIALQLLIAIELLALTAAALQSDLGFDAVFNFEIKARIAFENSTRGQIPLDFFGDASRVWSHARYPLLVPFTEYWIYGWLGRVDQSAVKIVFPMFYVALMCVTAGAVRRVCGGVAAVAAVAAIGTLPAVTVIPGAISGYAEVPLAAAITAAGACALIAVREDDARAFWLAGALSAVAAWTKVEGTVLALSLAAAGFFLSGRKALPLLSLPVFVISAWTIFQSVHGLPEKDFPSLSPLVAVGNIQRAPTIARAVVRELVTPGHWGLLWPAFGVVCALALRTNSWRTVDVIAGTVVILPLCLYPLIYLFSSWTDVEGRVRTSFVRLVVPLVPMAIVFTASQLWPPRIEAVTV